MEISHETDDEMRPHYDFSQMKGAVRGKYAGRTSGVTHIYGLILDTDLATLFPDAASVNAALRQYLKDHPQPTNPA